ncbi:MAG TPA: Hsp20 family protein [Rhodocyclaceae bacterium]|nr:Hsp20 family protein [Rhodocyclaceae bacterium]
MAKIEKSIELEAPVRTVYNQMTQFEEFPKFMADVREVRQLDDTHLRWRAEVAGKEVEWDGEITEQIPNQRIAWRCPQDASKNGEVRFESLGENRTRIVFSMEISDTGAGEKRNPDAVAARAEQDLQRFKQFIESRARESGAWRGEVHGARVTGNAQSAGDEVARATQTAIDDASRLGKKTMQAANENVNRVSQQATEFVSDAFKTQSSAVNAANTALRPFRSSFFGPQPWFSTMLTAFNEPLGMMRRFSEELNNEFESMISHNRGLGAGGAMWMPSVDVSRQNDQIIINADLPGIRKEDVSVEVDEGRLTIHGERRAQHESVQQDSKRVECHYGSFTRVIPLPEEIDVERAEASVSNGVLQIKLPLTASQRRRIEVRSGEEQSERRQAQNANQPTQFPERRSSANRSQQSQQRSAA